MKYDFVEIGCCHFDTCVDEYGLDSVGLLVEPIKEYYDVLPHSDTVKKECCAISDTEGKINFTAAINPNPVYYTHDEVVEMTHDPEKYHKYSREVFPVLIGGHSSVYTEKMDPGVHQFCKNITVDSMTFKSLCAKHNITEINHLKIDVEGVESIILKDLFDLLESGLIYVNQIRFEYNHLSNLKELDDLIDKFKLKGYVGQFIKEGFNDDYYLTKDV